ncbi:MAG: ABC transporter ATP-binding protein [Chloroflexi bacterium]|nr:ABC transporter ATP-binding protein [Chloroflexota bacterium]
MLELHDIHTYYGDSHILQGVSLTVARGEVVALLGRNGAGKTTTIATIVGFAPPRSGRVIFHGHDLTRAPSYQIVRRGIGLVPQGRRIFPDLTVRENILLGARLPATLIGGPARDLDRGQARAARGWTWERALETFPALKDKTARLGGQLSGGEQQMVAIARALLTNPELLLLDEPSEGLAPLIVHEIGRIIAQLKQDGFSILLVEQNLNLALTLADRVYVISKGQIVFEGASRALRDNADIERQYLGV